MPKIKQTPTFYEQRKRLEGKIATLEATLQPQMGKLQRALSDLMASCPHPNVRKIAKSNAGNYDPSADRYWYECLCPDCEKRWVEDQ